jgi:SAM-dependent methyltransferase
VTALEPDPSAVVGAGAIRSLAAETELPIRVVEDLSEGLPFADSEFDVVFARAVLHHTRDLDRACAEMFRVLRQGGIFVAVREHVISKESDLQDFRDDHPLHHLYGGEHAFLLDRYLGALRSAGFEPVEVLSPLQSPINLFPYTLDTLRDAVVERVTQKLSGRPFWRMALASDCLFTAPLSLASRFDNRPGRLYSFIAHKAA